MGKSLAEQYPIARKTFEEADQVLGRSISKVCYEGPAKRLTQTENTQTAILTVSVAAWRILDLHGCCPTVVAGHSLGEFSALVASGSLSFVDALLLVQQRANLMAQAAAKYAGGMVAVLGLDVAQVETVCTRVAEYGYAQIANINCPGQIVVSAETDALSAVVEFGLKTGARRCIPLSVSGAFHSRLMISASKQFRVPLEETRFAEPAVPIIANVTANYVAGAVQLPELLAEQITESVQWEGTIRRMWADGVRRFVEIGPGSVLSGLVKRTVRDAEVQSVDKAQDVVTSLEMMHETQG